MKPEPIYRRIGGIIRALRRRADKAQDVLAGQLGISRATLANIETGRQRILVHQLYAIAQALDVKLADLLPPSLTDGTAANDWSSLSIEGDLSADQKKQIANLIGSVGAPKRQQTEELNAKTTSASRNTRVTRSKDAR
jgi:transcriptional regulator with XRE-family HTH domain